MMPKISMCTPRAKERYDNALSLMRIAEKMTRYGFRVDLAKIAEHRERAMARRDRYQKMFCDMTGLPVAALGAAGEGHTSAIREHFTETLGAPDVEFDKKTKRPQFNNAALTTYATAYREQSFGPPAAALIGIRKNGRSVSFCDTYRIFAAQSATGDRIHFGFNPLGTVTGRWTSSAKVRIDGRTHSCNAQQIPSKSPEFIFSGGKPERLVESLRDIFIADDGCVLLKADYDQLELRLIAYVYNVTRLLKCIEDGKDAHILTASHIFKELGIDPNASKPSKADVSRDPKLKLLAMARDAAKPCAYGISYQMHDVRGEGRYPQLTKTLKGIFPAITERMVAKLAENFFATYPEIKEGQLACKEQVDALGYAELSIDGRRLYYPATMRGYNQRLNFPMQGTGGALCNRALLEIDPQLDWGAGCQVRVQCHDELLVQAPYKYAAEVKNMLEIAMSRKAQIGACYAGIPAAADPGFNWGDCKSWETFCAEHPSLLGSRSKAASAI